MKVHPLADLFPMLPDDELDAMAASIKEHGLRHPILTGEWMRGWRDCRGHCRRSQSL